LSAGVVTTGDGSYLSLIDSSDIERASITARATQTQLSLLDNNMQLDLGSRSEADDKAGVFLGKSDVPMAYMRLDQAEGGTVRIANLKGTIVAGLLTHADGGRVVVTGAGGGMIQGSLTGTNTGGNIFLYDKAGEQRVNLASSDKGEMHLRSPRGAIVATTGETAPSIKISDSSEAVLVGIGVSTSGVGLVSTGPGGNGPAGTLGAGLEAASSIQGKRE
jgi:hypothetical protein